jgi:regulatory protein
VVPPEREQAVDLAVRALARRDHSTQSLRAKLERAGFDADACDEAVEGLIRAGYLDDARFAQARAEALAARGYGDEWIRSDLEAQGVSRDTAEEAVGTLAPECERAIREQARLGRGARTAAALRRRGFSEDALESVLAEAVAEER